MMVTVLGYLQRREIRLTVVHLSEKLVQAHLRYRISQIHSETDLYDRVALLQYSLQSEKVEEVCSHSSQPGSCGKVDIDYRILEWSSASEVRDGQRMPF